MLHHGDLCHQLKQFSKAIHYYELILHNEVLRDKYESKYIKEKRIEEMKDKKDLLKEKETSKLNDTEFKPKSNNET
eukprot:CAMPEP_0116900004 /NCGR_PEP_ID=MMETSP0467-20121206/8445_1 /TAXON_ID=283647 /ORGANISM="Mesodinium pulex, Strain SPMC105" /LENGTH=75 /DNA_ID=CAMNT_0004573135 /DNA_START=565 /DNA_END=792 /DNA_ORIENTATION=-